MPNEHNSTGEIICSVVRSDPVQFEFKTNPRLVSKRLGGGWLGCYAADSRRTYYVFY